MKNMKIELEIPQEIIDHCRKLNIDDVNIPIVFKDYCQDKLGVYVGVAGNEFRIWTEHSDNIDDYVPKSKKAFVEVKMVVEIEMDINSSLEEAINEMSENLSTSDLISSNGCIIGGNIDEYIVQKIEKS
jgi:hypothetical protein